MYTAPIRIISCVALLTGLITGTAAPAIADDAPPRTVAAKSEPLIKKKCVKRFRADWRTLNYDVWAHAYDYYENRRKAEQVIYDQLRWLLADPEAQDLIPVHEAAAAAIMAEIQPVVTELRNSNYKDLKKFESRYLGNGCLSKAGKTAFKSGIRSLRMSFKDIYAAHEKLFGANFAVQTAQADKAGQYLQDADLEAATISENWKRSADEFRPLRYPK